MNGGKTVFSANLIVSKSEQSIISKMWSGSIFKKIHLCFTQKESYK